MRQRSLSFAVRTEWFKEVIFCRILLSKCLKSSKGQKNPISGEAISNELGITRSAVWKNIQELRAMGYDIFSSQKEGYKLTRTSNQLLPYEIHKKLKTAVYR